MFQVRIHGRGGQGVVTATELLSVAAFREGRHAQAFPSFGSERTGAPVGGTSVALASADALVVAPSAASVDVAEGMTTQTFTATVTGAPNTGTWSVNDVAGGDAIVGMIDSSGQYIAPSAVPTTRTSEAPVSPRSTPGIPEPSGVPVQAAITRAIAPAIRCHRLALR